MLTVVEAMRAGWFLADYRYSPDLALLERYRGDGLRERALARKTYSSDELYQANEQTYYERMI